MKGMAHALRVSKEMLVAITGAQLLDGEEGAITFKTSSLPLLADNARFNDLFAPKLSECLDDYRYLSWSTKTHLLFHEDQQLAVMEMLRCWTNRPDSLIASVPKETLFDIFRWVCSPPFSPLLRRCFQCNKVTENMSRCTNCKVARFCSVECQREAWPVHRIACQRQRGSSPSKRHRTRGCIVDMMREAATPDFVDPKYSDHAELVYGMK